MRAPAPAFAAFVMLGSTTALADQKQHCTATRDQAQGLVVQGKLSEARDTYFSCAVDVCASSVQTTCEREVARLDALLAKPKEAEPPRVTTTESGYTVWPHVLGATGAALLVTGAWSFFRWSHLQSEAEARRMEVPTNAVDPQLVEMDREARLMSMMTYSGVVLGAVSVGAAVALRLHESSRFKTSVTAAGPSGPGLTLRATF